jgi:hypothetical protein
VVKHRRQIAPLLLVVPVIAAGCGGDENEQQPAPEAGTTGVRDKQAAERPESSRAPPASGGKSRTPAGGLAQPRRQVAYRQFRDDVVGYSLRYPRAWTVGRRPAGATEFATKARCRSVEIVDFAPPPGSGIALVLHSFVQVCAKRLTDRSSIDEFMRQASSDSVLKQFEPGKFAGARAYRSRTKDQDVLFLQTDDYRIQIYTSVGADRRKRARRQAQVREVLRSFSLFER